MKTLGEILSDETPDDAATRDEQGRFAAEPPMEAAAPETGMDQEPEAPEPESGTPPQAPEVETERVPVAALRDERHKRQALEAELAHYRASQQPAQPMQTQAEQPADAPDMFEDPAGFQAWVRQAAASDAMKQARQEFALERTRASAIAAQTKYADYNDAIEAFKDLAATNPGLEQTMMQQPDPAEWAYRTAKTHMEVSQYGSLDAAINARVEAELAKRMAAQPQAPQLPKATLADAQSARAASVQPVKAKTLAEILAR